MSHFLLPSCPCRPGGPPRMIRLFFQSECWSFDVMESFVNRMKMIADIFDAPVRSSVVRRCLKRQNQDKIPFKTKSQPNCFPGHFPFAFYSLISLKTSLFSSEIEEPGDDEKCIGITPRLCLPERGFNLRGALKSVSFLIKQ